MALVQWNEAKYSVHEERIDTQHETLFELINRLHDSMKEGRSKESIPSTLNALVAYTKQHFGYEEGYMKRVGYPNLDQHRAQHEEFVSTVERFISDYNSGKVGLTFQIINYLKDWLISHILKTDKQYDEFVAQK